MTLNFYSKHGIIIGIVTMLTTFLISLSELPRLARLFNSDDYISSVSTWDIAERIGILTLVVLAGVFSGVLILGIVKKLHLLVAPLLVVGFLLSAVLDFTVIYTTVTRTYFHLDNYIPIVLLIGLEIIILYPIWHLFTEIRRDNVTVGNPKASKSNYAHN